MRFRGRFGRRRRGGSGEGRAPAIDAARELTRVAESGLVPPGALAPAPDAEIPASLAAVGLGEGEDGRRLVVAVSPQSGGDAWLAAVALGSRLAAQQGFAGEVWALSPRWPLAARRRLSLLGAAPFRIQAVAEPPAPGAGRDRAVVPEPPEEAALASPDPLAAHLAEPAQRALFRRAVAGLEGLAAKHGGGVRVSPRGVELVLLTRTAAIVEVGSDGPRLEAREPQRTSYPLSEESLRDALDRLEGSLRKFLNDRKIRHGEEGLRASLAGLLARSAEVGDPKLWPSAGSSPDPLDFVGVDASGRVVAGAVRRELSLDNLGALLDGAVATPPRLLACLPGVRLASLRLVVAAERIEPAAARTLAALGLESALFEVTRPRRGEPVLTPVAAPTLAPAQPQPVAPRPGPPPTPRPEPERAALPAAVPAKPETSRAAEPETPRAAEPRRRFEELSVFELAEEGRAAEEGAPRSAGGGRRRRRRGRGRSRGGREAGAVESRRERGADEEVRERDADDDADARRFDEEAAVERLEADEEDLAPAIAADESELAALGSETPPTYEDEEEFEEEGEEESMRLEREARRRARLAKTQPEPVAPAPPAPRPVRRRAAIVAHADRDALGAAVLLARDLRLVEGLWVYPQAELMTFFRSVATDLREETPIYLVGFTASPARDTLQAASLYRGRLFWFDHHDWPPEDLEGLRAAIGAENVFVEPGVGSALPGVVAQTSRRSRFTDKLVDVLTGRFTRHDYERWGRLWWWRLGEIARQSGERRADVAALLAGRPSDLARDASRSEAPPLPPELDFVARHDFRVVHFGGYTLVLVPTPPELDPNLCARIARERHEAQLTLAWSEGGERLILAGDDASARRSLDLGALVEHLDAKFDWLKPLSDADQVARFRVQELATRPERLDEVVSEIAMGRSLLEG